MVAYTKPQHRKKEESELLRGERDKNTLATQQNFYNQLVFLFLTSLMDSIQPRLYEKLVEYTSL